MTLIDSLSTLAILASPPPSEKGPNKALDDFQDAIALFVKHYGDGSNGPERQGLRAAAFDLDSKVQVFETAIRGLGGLLSAHQFAVGDLPIRGYSPNIPKDGGRIIIPWKNGFTYNGQLLRLAWDLGNRLLPAFYTETGIPYPRVNLRYGVPFYANCPLNVKADGQCPKSQPTEAEITETCSAGAGSLVLEFTALSRLTGDNRFELVAKRAFWAIWERRSVIGLIGSGIDAESGLWVSPYTGIGAGIDSFFEYAFKAYVMLSGMPELEGSAKNFLGVWQEAHNAIKRNVLVDAPHQHYLQVDLSTGAPRALWIDALSAFYPGLLALAGELEEAIAAHLLYTALWSRYSAIPERWSTSTGNVEGGLGWWIGRPEFIESNYYLYRATKDPWYLHVGEMALRDIKRRCWTKCGWAGLQDVRSGEKKDRMESFFLGETAQYLFLLFDKDHPLNHMDSSVVFSTEGHPLTVPKRYWNNGIPDDFTHRELPESALAPIQQAICPLPPSNIPLSLSATAARTDIFHAAFLARLHLMPTIETRESPLLESSEDHPSISLSDLSSPSNYTYYPWTLPPELIPPDATCSRMDTKMTFDLSFPNLPDKAPAFGSLERVKEGIFVTSTSGLRLAMIKETIMPSTHGERTSSHLFRIYAVSNVPLGRDEKVFLKRDLVSSFNPVDPLFTRTRDLQLLDLVLDVSSDLPNLDWMMEETGNGSMPSFVNQAIEASSFANKSSMLYDWLSYIFNEMPRVELSEPLARQFEPATLPLGPGAAPIEDMDDSPMPAEQESYLPWTSIAFAGDLCDSTLPTEIAKENHVLVLRRGGCNFSEKLRNIPSFAPTDQSLRLVVVVDYGKSEENGPEDQYHDGSLFQPYLDQIQMTPAGLPRPHPIPMVLVGGGEQTVVKLLSAKGVGVRRRWWFESQGVRIGNLIVL